MRLASSLFRLAVLALALAAFPSAASAYTVEILTVRSVRASESDGDELRLHISVDGKAETTLSKTLKGGHVWTLNRKIDFNTSVRLRLTEYDPLLPDDHFGTEYIQPWVGTRSMTFSRNGGTFSITYRVTNGHNGFILRLHSLTCHKAQEGNGDDIVMKIQKDMPPTKRVAQRNMRTGQVWELKYDIHFFHTAGASFHDSDLLPWDDHLGGFLVPGVPTGGPRARIFARDGMHYKLTYEVLRK